LYTTFSKAFYFPNNNKNSKTKFEIAERAGPRGSIGPRPEWAGRRAGNRREGAARLGGSAQAGGPATEEGRRRTRSAATGAVAPTSRRRSGGRRRPTADLRLGVESPSTHGSRERVVSTTARNKRRRRERGRRRRSSSSVAGDGGAGGKEEIEPHRRRARDTEPRSEKRRVWRSRWRDESRNGAAVERERRRALGRNGGERVEAASGCGCCSREAGRRKTRARLARERRARLQGAWRGRWSPRLATRTPEAASCGHAAAAA
jgi:hypothetical protein